MKQLNLNEEQYEILVEIIELATRMGYDREEVESILDGLVAGTEEPERIMGL